MTQFQSLYEFIENPFGFSNNNKRNDLEKKYQRIKNKSNFEVKGFTTIEDNYLIHVTVPSDSNPKQFYDVVVLFFTDESVIKKRTTFSNYYVKFFSNSPSFVYTYAFLYKEHGFLIDDLYDKLDKGFLDNAPTKSNKDFELFYDKSIYCAGRLLLDNSMILLSKLGIITKHKKNQTAFFKDIQSFENIKIVNELKSIDKKINKELEENKKIKRRGNRSKSDPHRKNASSNTLASTSQKSIKRVVKKKGIKKR